MATIDDAAIRFMADLHVNNNKTWFDANRERYGRELREPVKRLRDELEPLVAALLPSLPPPKISRINADIRFTKDKAPYKEHLWIKWVEKPGELMAALSHEGWCGVASACGEKEELETWRRNLIEHHALWRKYAQVLGLREKVLVHTGDPYKKPLYPDIPGDVFDLVQAKVIYIFPAPNPHFSRSPEGDFVRQLTMLLPAHLFMTVPGRQLPDALAALGAMVVPPDETVAKVWRAVNE